MTAPFQQSSDLGFSNDHGLAIFGQDARDLFEQSYPETPCVLSHSLDRHPLLELDALADLGSNLPAASVEYNRGDLPIGVDGKPGETGLTIAETIRNVRSANSWAVLKNVEQVPLYKDLLGDLLSELEDQIVAKTGEMLTPQAFIFVSSPNAVTPYHFDPEHNILLQIAGSKVMTQFPAGNARYAPDETHESYHLGGPRELHWDESFAQAGQEFAIGPGRAVHVPVMAPHFVRNGPDSSISLSITWRSEWSYAEAGARCFNALLRRAGLEPQQPKRWPGSNRNKDLAFRAWRRLFGAPKPVQD
jgi:hypothetical protein